MALSKSREANSNRVTCSSKDIQGFKLQTFKYSSSNYTKDEVVRTAHGATQKEFVETWIVQCLMGRRHLSLADEVAVNPWRTLVQGNSGTNDGDEAEEQEDDDIEKFFIPNSMMGDDDGSPTFSSFFQPSPKKRNVSSRE